MDFGITPVMMSLPAKLRDGASSPFHNSPPLGRFISDPLGEGSCIDAISTKIVSPRSRRRAEMILSPNHSSARSQVARLVSWNDASINSTQSERQSLHLEALQYPSPCSSPTPKKVHQYSSQEVAQTLTLIDAELLRQIAPDELQNGAWMKKDLKHKLAPHVLAMVHASNDLAMLVPSEILAETTTHARAKVISSFIKIASKCYRLHNYNSLKAVLAGLQCTPIFRLKKTWKEVPSKRKKQFERLSSIMSEEYNWSEYQQRLQDLLTNNHPCIPFLGVLLSNIAQQESTDAVYNSTGGSGPYSRRRESLRKISGVQDYLVLEAITVRNNLERLRKNTWRHSTGITSKFTTDHISLARQRAIRRRSRYPKPKLDNSIADSSYRSRTNAYSISIGQKNVISETLTEEVSLLSPTEDGDSVEGGVTVFVLQKDEGILQHRNFSSSSESDDSPLVTRKALNKRYQIPVNSEQTRRGRFSGKSVSSSGLNMEDRNDTRPYKISVSEIDISLTKKASKSLLLNPQRLLSQTDSSSDASSNSSGELPRKVPPRVSISHIEVELEDNNGSVLESGNDEVPSDVFLKPINSTIVPSRSLEGLCSSLEIEEDGQVRSSFQFGIGQCISDKKSVSMQSLLSETSLSSGDSSSACSSTNPSTSSLLSPTTTTTKTNRIMSCAIDDLNDMVPQSPVLQNGSPNDDKTKPDKPVSGSNSSSENDDIFTECPIDNRPLTQPRCSIDHLEGPVFLRPRRGGSTVQQMAQTASPKLANSTDLLNKYQFLSLGCCEGLKNMPELRELLVECPHNTEGQNYKLSYEREP